MKNLTFGFIGLGLIGGSIAKALKNANPMYKIIVFDVLSETLSHAKEDMLADIIVTNIDETFLACDYIFLCGPVSINEKNLERLIPFISKECMITDVGSVKTPIHNKISELHLDRQFIGGHPMTGSERTGFLNAKASLLENAYYIISPGVNVPEYKITEFFNLVTSMKAIPLIVECKEHDYITAAISHVPHMIAYALVHLIETQDSPEQMMKTIAAGGFRDITRIASSSPGMWQQICMANSKNITSILDTYLDTLKDLRDKIHDGDDTFLYNYFEKSGIYRESFVDQSLGPIKKVFTLFCDIPDKPGALAAIVRILAEEDISIKNIGIVHNREFEEGVLRIELYDEAAVYTAKTILTKNGYPHLN